MNKRADIVFSPGCTGTAVFTPLTRLHTLGMAHCSQPELGDDILDALPSLKRLDVSYCSQFTAAAFFKMRRLEWLCMDSCADLPHSDATLSCLGGLVELSMRSCIKAPFARGLDGAPFPVAVTCTGWESLRGIHTLDIRGNQVPEEAQAVLQACVPVLRGGGVYSS